MTDRSSPVSETDAAMTPKELVDSILSACDPSNWDSDRNKGAYYRGLHDAYTAIHEIAGEYQTAMYEWTRTRDLAQCSREAVIEECAAVCEKHSKWAEDLIEDEPEGTKSQIFATISNAADDCAAMIRDLKSAAGPDTSTTGNRAQAKTTAGTVEIGPAALTISSPDRGGK